VDTSATGTSITERILFKIDTVTGQTWEYISTMGSKKGTIAEKWIEIEE